MSETAFKIGDEFEIDGKPVFIISAEDYDRLLMGAETDDMLVECERCGAWLDREDEAVASTDDYTGCWKSATGRPKDEHLCRAYRVCEAQKKIRAAWWAARRPQSRPKP